jgi:S-adenosyl-L-methionine hydrolase (adenosine-forming)
VRSGKNGRGDTETRGHGEKISGLRVAASAAGGAAKARAKSPPTSLRRPVSESQVPLSLPPIPPLITLLSDFGSADFFVGAMKAVILGINPDARLVDLSHDIPAHDIAAAAFNLLVSYSYFPAHTIHLTVVDPGVGSARRPILVMAGEQVFVGPDNGLFGWIIEREPGSRVFHITNEKFFRRPVSSTFHGRDIFAPVAAALSMGVQPEQLGTEIEDPVGMGSLVPVVLGKDGLQGRIIHIDRFGNCVTNLTRRELTPEMIQAGARIIINGRKIDSFREFFSEQQGKRKKLFAVWGSAGFLEVAAQNRSAAKILKVERGKKVVVLIEP